MNDRRYRLRPAALLLAALTLGLAAPCAAQVTAKRTPEMYFLYRKNLGPYSRVDRAFLELEKFLAKHALEGPIIGVYYDNPARTAPSLQRADLGVRVSRDLALEILRKARPDDAEEALVEELDAETGAMIDDPYYVRKIASQLVAARTVTAPFDEMYRYYSSIQQWIWNNDYFLIGPVREIYYSPVRANKNVRAEIQIGIERTGVPDRR